VGLDYRSRNARKSTRPGREPNGITRQARLHSRNPGNDESPILISMGVLAEGSELILAVKPCFRALRETPWGLRQHFPREIPPASGP